MYTVNGMTRVVGFLALAAVAQTVQAQVTVRCGGDSGQASTTVAGYHLNNLGELVFNESPVVCGAVVGTPDVPNRLSAEFSITGPVVNTEGTQATVTFSGTTTNFDMDASFFNDACIATVRNSSNSVVGSTPITPNASGQFTNRQVTFPISGAAQYSAAVTCTRDFKEGLGAPQQAYVVNPLARTVTVEGGGLPTHCPQIHSVFQRLDSLFDAPHVSNSGGWGGNINSSIPQRRWNITRNTTAPDTANGEPNFPKVTSVTLRTWSFVAPANASREITSLISGVNPSAVSISECPGDYRPVLDSGGQKCRGNGSLAWSSSPSSQHALNCHLVPGRTYYLNLSVFNIGLLDQHGNYFSSASCGGTNCTVEQVYQ